MTRAAFVALALAAGPALAQSGGTRYALVVGIDAYDPTELKSLRFAADDAADLAATLRDAGYRADDIVLMTPRRGAEAFRFAPTADHVRRELGLLLKAARPADSVLVAFAGHGVQFRGEDEVYFCPVDAKLADRTTLVSLTKVYGELAGCAAGFKLLLSDACRDDPLAGVARSPTVVLESKSRPARPDPPRGVVAIFGCAAGGRAFESPTLRHGVFFYHVIEALKGKADGNRDGRVTLNELDDYVLAEVARTVRAEFGTEQTPQRVGTTVGQPPPLAVLASPVVRRPKLPPPQPVARRADKRTPPLTASADGCGVYRVGPARLACFAADADPAADAPLWTFDAPGAVRQAQFGGGVRGGRVIVVTDRHTVVLTGDGRPVADPKPLRLDGAVERIEYDPATLKFTLHSGRQQTRIGN